MSHLSNDFRPSRPFAYDCSPDFYYRPKRTRSEFSRISMTAKRNVFSVGICHISFFCIWWEVEFNFLFISNQPSDGKLLSNFQGSSILQIQELKFWKLLSWISHLSWLQIKTEAWSHHFGISFELVNEYWYKLV